LKNKELGVDLWVMSDVGIEKVWCGLCGMSVWGVFIEPFFLIWIGLVQFGFISFSITKLKPNRTGGFSKYSNWFFFMVRFFQLHFFLVFCSPLGVAIRFRGINHVWRYKFYLRVQVLFRRTCDQFTDKRYKVWTKYMVSRLRRDARSI
jgi:hypothetical protein